MVTLQISVLGELELRRGTQPVTLPPSRKTRALLAYLVLGGRTYRREALCDLLWDVADDPRSELRWSLSKLRNLLDDDGATRIDAGREDVTFRAHGAVIDLVEIREALARRPLRDMPTDELEGLARRFRGELLEGLDLPDFDSYQAWCVAQREDARATRLRILRELVGRLRSEPARAVEHARVHVTVDPDDLDARIALVELLAVLGRKDEARAHYETGTRLATSPQALAQLDSAWRATTSRSAAPVMRSSPSITLPPCNTLIGRERDLAILDRALADATATARLRVVVIAGSIGTGKSRLLEAWLGRARGTGAAIAHTAALEADRGRPYAPWLALVKDASTAATDRDALFEQVATALAHTAATRTLVVAFDDAHWLAPEAAAMLAHVARRSDRSPILIALAARPGELDDNVELTRVLRGLRQSGALVEHDLQPLDKPSTIELVRAVRDDVDPVRVYARSGGNPLFALELARAGDLDDTETPRSLATLVRDRVAELPEDVAAVLRWAAVLRRGITTSTLEGVAGVGAEDIVDALDVLVVCGYLTRAAGAAHEFAHELVRQVVYDTLSEPRRRLMHRRIAELLAYLLERGDDSIDIADVAHHAAAAHDALLATGACLTAAKRSLRGFAWADAAALARRGLRHAEQLADPERTCRAIELYELVLAVRRPEGDRTARELERLAERALDLGALEHARLGYHLLAYARWDSGSWHDAQRHMRHAQLISRAAPEAEQILSMAETARCLVMLEKELPEAQALALEAEARGRLAGVEPPATFVALGMLHLHRGEHAAAREQLERGLAIAHARRERMDEFQAAEQLVVLDLAAGEHVHARTRARDLVSIGSRLEGGSEAPFARGLHALARIGTGEPAEVELDAALDELDTLDAKQRLSYLASRAAWHDLEQGARDRAARLATRALTAALALERTSEIALARAVLARLDERDIDVTSWTEIAADVRERLRPFVPERVSAREEVS